MIRRNATRPKTTKPTSGSPRAAPAAGKGGPGPPATIPFKIYKYAPAAGTLTDKDLVMVIAKPAIWGGSIPGWPLLGLPILGMTNVKRLGTDNTTYILTYIGTTYVGATIGVPATITAWITAQGERLTGGFHTVLAPGAG